MIKRELHILKRKIKIDLRFFEYLFSKNRLNDRNKRVRENRKKSKNLFYTFNNYKKG
jgi:hypothetical protein